jgi:hypothetical protein
MGAVDKPISVPECYFDVMTDAKETFQTFCITNRPMPQTTTFNSFCDGKPRSVIFRTLKILYLRKHLQAPNKVAAPSAH